MGLNSVTAKEFVLLKKNSLSLFFVKFFLWQKNLFFFYLSLAYQRHQTAFLFLPALNAVIPYYGNLAKICSTVSHKLRLWLAANRRHKINKKKLRGALFGLDK